MNFSFCWHSQVSVQEAENNGIRVFVLLFELIQFLISWQTRSALQVFVFSSRLPPVCWSHLSAVWEADSRCCCWTSPRNLVIHHVSLLRLLKLNPSTFPLSPLCPITLHCYSAPPPSSSHRLLPSPRDGGGTWTGASCGGWYRGHHLFSGSSRPVQHDGSLLRQQAASAETEEEKRWEESQSYH